MSLPPETLSLADAAGRLGVSRSWAYAQARAGERELVEGVVILRIGSMYKVSRVQLDRFLGVRAEAS